MELNQVSQGLMEVADSSDSMQIVNRNDLKKTNTFKSSEFSSKTNKSNKITETDVELNLVLQQVSHYITRIFESTNDLKIFNYDDLEKTKTLQSGIYSPKTNNKRDKSVKKLKRDHYQTKAVGSLKSNANQSLDAKNTPSSLTINTTASQTDDAIMNITNNEICDSLRKYQDAMVTMQLHSNITVALRDIFKSLEVHDLLKVSRVCTAWNTIAMSDSLWKTVCLKNSKVTNWEQCINIVDRKYAITLDTRHMVIPNQINENKHFWSCFNKAIMNAKKLKTIELYRCPTHVVENTIYSLRQLEVFNATTIEYQPINSIEFMTLSLKYLNKMTQLTEIRIKGLGIGINLLSLSSFSELKNLKILSLTGIKIFPEEICFRLLTLNKKLEVLEIGGFDCLSKDVTFVLENLVNLKSLRLENCNGKWNIYNKDIFRVIRRLKNLQILELINIKFSDNMVYDLEKCGHIKSLLIIPDYKHQSSAINIHLFNRLKILSKTLSHLVLGITNESLHGTDLVNEYLQSMYNVELSKKNETYDKHMTLIQNEAEYIPQLDETIFKTDKEVMSRNFNTFKVQEFEKLLKTVFENVKTKLVKIPFSETTQVYLANEFNDIIIKNKAE